MVGGGGVSAKDTTDNFLQNFLFFGLKYFRPQGPTNEKNESDYLKGPYIRKMRAFTIYEGCS